MGGCMTTTYELYPLDSHENQHPFRHSRLHRPLHRLDRPGLAQKLVLLVSPFSSTGSAFNVA